MSFREFPWRCALWYYLSLPIFSYAVGHEASSIIESSEVESVNLTSCNSDVVVDSTSLLQFKSHRSPSAVQVGGIPRSEGKEDLIQHILDAPDTQPVTMASVATATVGVTQWAVDLASGKLNLEKDPVTAIKQGAAVFLPILMGIDPLLGALVGIGFALFSALPGAKPEDPTVELYKRIMQEVKDLIDRDIKNAILLEHRHNANHRMWAVQKSLSLNYKLITGDDKQQVLTGAGFLMAIVNNAFSDIFGGAECTVGSPTYPQPKDVVSEACLQFVDLHMFNHQLNLAMIAMGGLRAYVTAAGFAFAVKMAKWRLVYSDLLTASYSQIRAWKSDECESVLADKVMGDKEYCRQDYVCLRQPYNAHCKPICTTTKEVVAYKFTFVQKINHSSVCTHRGLGPLSEVEGCNDTVRSLFPLLWPLLENYEFPGLCNESDGRKAAKSWTAKFEDAYSQVIRSWQRVFDRPEDNHGICYRAACTSDDSRENITIGLCQELCAKEVKCSAYQWQNLSVVIPDGLRTQGGGKCKLCRWDAGDPFGNWYCSGKSCWPGEMCNLKTKRCEKPSNANKGQLSLSLTPENPGYVPGYVSLRAECGEQPDYVIEDIDVGDCKAICSSITACEAYSYDYDKKQCTGYQWCTPSVHLSAPSVWLHVKKVRRDFPEPKRPVFCVHSWVDYTSWHNESDFESYEAASSTFSFSEPSKNCTKLDDDPYAAGGPLACCPNLQMRLADWDKNGNFYYRCVVASSTARPSETSKH